MPRLNVNDSYDEVVAINFPYFKMRLGNYWGAMDDKRNVVWPCQYDDVYHVDEEGGIYCKREDDVYYIKK